MGLQMGRGASKSGITIQYCMPYPRHILQSVEVHAVTNFRASDDYHAGNDQWRLGLSSIIPVAPSDMIGKSNVELIMRSARKDGLLLKPSHPATSVDATFAFRAFGTG